MRSSGRQHVRDGGLHPEADPREARLPELDQGCGIHRIGVGLGGDLGARGERPGLADRRQHPGQIGCGQQRRRAAAEEHGRDRTRLDAFENPRREPDLGDRLVGVRVPPGAAQLLRRVGVEVAVAAAHPAERHVDIDPEVALGGAGRRGRRQRPVGRSRVAERQHAGHQRRTRWKTRMARLAVSS